jgi:starch synthase
MTGTTRNIIMIASENDALKGGKVGGVGDVVRDLPVALASLGWKTTVVIPSYGFLHTDNPSRFLKSIQFPFSGKTLTGDLYEVTPRRPVTGVTHLVFEHPELRGEPVYFNDPPDQTFARDASKYALFCSAIGRYLRDVTPDSILHLHDWHAATLLLLQRLHPDFRHLAAFKTVFTIHNLSIQGSRPMKGQHATVQHWFPELFGETSWISDWKDPRYKDPTYTPMVVGIRFAEKLNTVSPSYAVEILQASDHARGFYGGEGLESLLRQSNADHRLFGILNGAEYPTGKDKSRMSWQELCGLMEKELRRVLNKSDFHPIVLQRIESVRELNPAILLTSVTRVVEQKIKLLFEKSSRGRFAIDEIHSFLEKYNGAYVFIGTGTSDYEQKLIETVGRCRRFIFINVYSAPVSEALYANGTIFMMPSSFEPCGISQMIAMREGQPCVVHAVGGLKDTVIDGVNGFQFSGSTLQEQVDNLIETTEKAIRTAAEDSAGWKKICKEASEAQFTWEKSARQYSNLLYS